MTAFDTAWALLKMPPYHGTDHVAAEKIMVEGLKPHFNDNAYQMAGFDKVIFATDNEQEAFEHAEDDTYGTDLKPVVIHIADDVETADSSYAPWHLYDKIIPPDKLRIVRKMPFVSPDQIPEVAWAGVLGSVHPYEREKRDFWVDNIEDPDAWGMHRNRDYRTGDGTHIGAEIPFFEIHPSIRGKGRGREALIQYIRELKQLPEGENMRPSSKVIPTGVIPSSRGFWERMYEDGIIQDYHEG